jgi:ABC-type sugar transport system permease subunit
MITEFLNKIKKEKKIVYANETELKKIESRLNTQLEKQQVKLEILKKLYITKAQRKQETNKGSLKKILKLTKRIQRKSTKIQKTKEELVMVADQLYIKHSFLFKLKRAFSGISNKNQKVIWGALFILPWTVGFLIFFFPPVLKSLWWSFNDVTPNKTELITKFVGFDNYIELFREYVIDGNRIFNVELLLFVQNLAIDLPIILIFSLFIAVLLNTKFKGHQFVKAVFFIPVIYNVSIISSTLSNGFGVYLEGSGAGILLTAQLTEFLREIGIGGSFVGIVTGAVDRIFMIVNYSGIQILIFIAALQSIPNQLYEAAKVEGASKYETFWKITIPMVTPMLLTTAIYTVIDSFARAPIYRFLDYATIQSRYGLASSIAMSYFVINLAIILIVLGLLKGLVFYYDDK